MGKEWTEELRDDRREMIRDRGMRYYHGLDEVPFPETVKIEPHYHPLAQYYIGHRINTILRTNNMTPHYGIMT